MNITLFNALAGPYLPGITDALNAFTRQQLARPGYCHFACPSIPEGAPWWEVGWEARFVIKHHLYMLAQRERLAHRKMTRDQWQNWSRYRRPGRRADSQALRDAQFAESYNQMGRVVSLIRGAALEPRGDPS